jgi:hypothetical protein
MTQADRTSTITKKIATSPLPIRGATSRYPCCASRWTRSAGTLGGVPVLAPTPGSPHVSGSRSRISCSREMRLSKRLSTAASAAVAEKIAAMPSRIGAASPKVTMGTMPGSGNAPCQTLSEVRETERATQVKDRTSAVPIGLRIDGHDEAWLGRLNRGPHQRNAREGAGFT